MIDSDGLFDLQVNGYAGVDFNDASLTTRKLDTALTAMRAAGVTGVLITNSDRQPAGRSLTGSKVRVIRVS